MNNKLKNKLKKWHQRNNFIKESDFKGFEKKEIIASSDFLKGRKQLYMISNPSTGIIRFALNSFDNECANSVGYNTFKEALDAFNKLI